MPTPAQPAPTATLTGVYDAWHRLVSATKAYRACADDGFGGVSLGAVQEGSVVLVNTYDGAGRRIGRTITNAGHRDGAEHYYYSASWQPLETRNGSDLVQSQYVWAGQPAGYIDELVQLALNDDPTDVTEDDCETFYYALQDANFNVLGVVDASGAVVERYEYTPYGRRLVYAPAGSNDPRAQSPRSGSRRYEVGGLPQPWGVNPFGHQGLMHEELLPDGGLIHNRYRMLHPTLGRFVQRDLAIYIDGLNLRQYLQSRTSGSVFDATGLFSIVEGWGGIPAPLRETRAAHNSIAPNPANISYRNYIAALLVSYLSGASPYALDDAVDYFKHWLDGSGAQRGLPIPVLIRDSDDALANLHSDIFSAMNDAESEGAWIGTTGRTRFHMASNWAGNTINRPLNWVGVLRGYSAAAEALVEVERIGSNQFFTMEFRYHLFKEYNFDPGETFPFPLTAIGLGHGGPLDDLHRSGLAKNFDIRSMETIRVKWCRGSRLTREAVRRAAEWGFYLTLDPDTPLPDPVVRPG